MENEDKMPNMRLVILYYKYGRDYHQHIMGVYKTKEDAIERVMNLIDTHFSKILEPWPLAEDPKTKEEIRSYCLEELNTNNQYSGRTDLGEYIPDIYFVIELIGKENKDYIFEEKFVFEKIISGVIYGNGCG